MRTKCARCDAVTEHQEKLGVALEAAEESTRFYRNEWESVCERLRYRDEELESAKRNLKAETAMRTQDIRLLETARAAIETQTHNLNVMNKEWIAYRELAQDLRDALRLGLVAALNVRGVDVPGDYQMDTDEVISKAIAEADTILGVKNE